MYSLLKSVQIVVASLKTHGVRLVVHCPGGSDAPIGISFDTDEYFTCYSVVDERSALFFAIGLSLSNGREAVAVVCTSGTAVSNLSSGITEAYYKGVPVIAITADRSPYLLGQFEIQKIDQRNIFSECTKYEADLPIVHDEDEARFCDRLVNEALLEATSGIPGPVHINVPVVGKAGCYARTLPKVKAIRRHLPTDSDNEWLGLAEQLRSFKKIMVIIGENFGLPDQTVQAMEAFFDCFGCVFSVEHMSNYHGKGAVHTYRATEAMVSSAFDQLSPDLVIDFGGHVATVKLKTFLRERAGQFAHWSIREDGSVRDGFMSLTEIFWCPPEYFFSRMVSLSGSWHASGNDYYEQWMRAVEFIDPPRAGLSNFTVARELARLIPPSSVLELGILHSVRVMQFFDLDSSILVTANLGALGIDGCLSTAAGMAAGGDRDVFIMQGDLSFLYDMNALSIRYIGPRLHVLVVNNGGGGEFHINGMAKAYPEVIDEYLAASHTHSAEGWARQCGFEYLSVRRADELTSRMESFVKKGERPVLLEVFTDRYADAESLDAFYQANSGASSMERAKGAARNVAKQILSLGR